MSTRVWRGQTDAALQINIILISRLGAVSLTSFPFFLFMFVREVVFYVEYRKNEQGYVDGIENNVSYRLLEYCKFCKKHPNERMFY